MRKDSGDLQKELESQGFKVVSCDSAGNVELEKDATDEQRASARAIARSFDFTAEKPQPIPPLNEDEIRWVRDQMKAKTNAR